MDNSTRTQRPLVLAIVIIATFLAGTVVGSVMVPTRAQQSVESSLRKLTGIHSQTDLDVFAQAWNLVQSRYVSHTVDTKTLVQGAIDGMLKSLKDPYSYFLTQDDTKSFDNELNGKFDGIGAELGQRDNAIVVIAPIAGTPADSVGLHAGDVIRTIDGTSTDGMTLDDAVSKIRGADGTTVTLGIARGSDPVKDYTITRSHIQLKSVALSFTSRNASQYAVISITSFSQTTGSEFAQLVHDIALKQPKGIVIDLRNNSGGYLESAVNVADQFIQDGAIVTEDYGNGKKDVTNANGTATLSNYPVAVLMNGGTASAAEILAGALEDRINAITIGDKSFGKGSVQELETLDDGSTVKLTIAHWLTPNGRLIDKTGLTPKYSVSLTDQDVQAHRDPQLDKALEVLGGKT